MTLDAVSGTVYLIQLASQVSISRQEPKEAYTRLRLDEIPVPGIADSTRKALVGQLTGTTDRELFKLAMQILGEIKDPAVQSKTARTFHDKTESAEDKALIAKAFNFQLADERNKIVYAEDATRLKLLETCTDPVERLHLLASVRTPAGREKALQLKFEPVTPTDLRDILLSVAITKSQLRGLEKLPAIEVEEFLCVTKGSLITLASFGLPDAIIDMATGFKEQHIYADVLESGLEKAAIITAKRDNISGAQAIKDIMTIPSRIAKVDRAIASMQQKV